MSTVPDPTPADVLAALVHGLGSPLGALVNHAHLLAAAAGGSAGPAPEELAPALGEAAARATCLLRGARRWLDAATEPLAPAPLRLEEALDEAARRLGVAVAWEGGPGPEVLADPACLARIAEELLANAAAAADGRAARVHARLLRSGGLAGVRLDDEGRGWGALAPVRAVQPFCSGRPDGTAAGIGLAVAAVCARRLGGRLEVDGEPHGAVLLELWLPTAPTFVGEELAP